MSPASRVPEVIASQASAANTAQTLTVDVSKTVGVIHLVTGTNINPTVSGFVTVRDETGIEVVHAFALANTPGRFHAYTFGDDFPGGLTMWTAQLARDQYDWGGGKGAPRPKRLVIDVPAQGVGVVSYLMVFAERA